MKKTKSMENKKSIKDLFKEEDVVKRLEDLLGKRKEIFISSVLQLSQTDNLKNCDAFSVLNAAITSATLNLSLDPGLGYAYIVPYNRKMPDGKYLPFAQFQIGYKGLIQLALRTNDYARINSIPVYANQFKFFNTLTEDLAGDFHIEGEGEPIGYAAYFALNSGFEKTYYWTMDKVKAHAGKYSKTYGKKNSSPWNDKDQFDDMAMKTVLKNALLKYGKTNTHMETAIRADQSVQIKEGVYLYPDNAATDENENTKLLVKNETLMLEVENAQDVETLQSIYEANKPVFSKDIQLMTALGKAKKALEL